VASARLELLSELPRSIKAPSTHGNAPCAVADVPKNLRRIPARWPAARRDQRAFRLRLPRPVDSVVEEIPRNRAGVDPWNRGWCATSRRRPVVDRR
jgi:hypothetical protein